MNLSPTESIVDTLRVHGPTCIGCQRHKRHIMLSYTEPTETSPKPVYDLFLTRQQARDLCDSLRGILDKEDAR